MSEKLSNWGFFFAEQKQLDPSVIKYDEFGEIILPKIIENKNPFIRYGDFGLRYDYGDNGNINDRTNNVIKEKDSDVSLMDQVKSAVPLWYRGSFDL